MTAYGRGGGNHSMGSFTNSGIPWAQYSDTSGGADMHQAGYCTRLPAVAALAAAMLLAMAAGITMYDEAWAQQGLQGEAASQESITITIGTGADGLDMHIRHVLNPSDTKTILRLVDSGTLSGSISISPATSTEESGDAKINGTVMPEINGTVAVIPPLDAEAAVEYTVSDAVSVLAGGIHTVQYTYPHTTLVIIPDGAETVFVNGRLIDLDGKQKIACHGCSMTLEYAVGAAAGGSGRTHAVQIDGYMEFSVHATARPDIKELEFDPAAGEIMIQSGSGSGPQFVTVSIPIQLMTGPFAVSLDGQKILYHDTANATHSTITMRLGSGGTITIGGVLAGHMLAYQQQQHAEQGQNDTGDTDGDAGIMWTAVIVAAVAAGVAAAVTYRIKVNRRVSRTSRIHTRQFGSHSQGIFRHIRPPTPPFQTV